MGVPIRQPGVCESDEAKTYSPIRGRWFVTVLTVRRVIHDILGICSSVGYPVG
jgi:hypothetical protein